MATIRKDVLKGRMTVSGNPPRIMRFPEAASQSFVRGEPVYLVGGAVTECGDNPTLILGFAAEPAANVAAGVRNVAVELAEPDTVFCANVYNGVAGADTTIALADRGRSMGLFRDTTNSKCFVSKDATGANGRVIVEDLVDEAGDTAGRLLFRIMSKYYQLFATS